ARAPKCVDVLAERAEGLRGRVAALRMPRADAEHEPARVPRLHPVPRLGDLRGRGRPDVDDARADHQAGGLVEQLLVQAEIRRRTAEPERRESRLLGDLPEPGARVATALPEPVAAEVDVPDVKIPHALHPVIPSDMCVTASLR